MPGRVSLEASSREELTQKLKHWGASAPDRLEQHGKQKELENWILNRFLKLTGLLQPEHFPVQIIERETPDFLLVRNGIELGIEVTTICDKKEQGRFRKEAEDLVNRQGPNLQTEFLWNFDEKFTKLASAFQVTLQNKTHKRKSYGETSCILVCYLNSPLFSERLLKLLIESFKETAEEFSHGFSDIYVYKEDALYLL